MSEGRDVNEVVDPIGAVGERADVSEVVDEYPKGPPEPGTVPAPEDGVVGTAAVAEPVVGRPAADPFWWDCTEI